MTSHTHTYRHPPAARSVATVTTRLLLSLSIPLFLVSVVSVAVDAQTTSSSSSATASASASMSMSVSTFPGNTVVPNDWAPALASSLGVTDFSSSFLFPTRGSSPSSLSSSIPTSTSTSTATMTMTKNTKNAKSASSSSAAGTSTNPSAKYIISNWWTTKITSGADNLFFSDVITSNSSNSSVADNSTKVNIAEGDVLKVVYPAGSYSHGTGGAGFDSTPFASQQAQSMLLSYSLYLPTDFNYVQGGKFPGLRGGSDQSGCSGGTQSDGSSCFSARIMFRPGGLGEIYAYIPPVAGLCTTSTSKPTTNPSGNPDVLCNDEFGTSFGRGEFSYERGAWNNLALYVQLNSPADVANGVLQLYYNNVLAINATGVAIRTSDALTNITSMMFSTFFGGSDSSYATPTEQSSYFTNITMYGSISPATAPGAKITSASAGTTTSVPSIWVMFLTIISVMMLGVLTAN